MLLATAQQKTVDDWVAVHQQLAGPAPTPVASTGPQGSSGHTFYASTYGSAHTIYCDIDPGWKGLSPKYLVSYPTLDAALAALPGYALQQSC